MPVHDWTKVSAGTFHDFHTSWITHLKEAFNDGVLPEGYYAMSEQHAGQVVPDVLTLKESRKPPTPQSSGSIAVAEAPPKVSLTMVPDESVTYRMARRSVTIRHASDHRIVAILEVVSSANKDRGTSVEEFAEKAVTVLGQGIHLLVVDLYPPGRHDPQGMHGFIWLRFDASGYTPPEGKPLTLASYAVNALPRAYVEPLAVGDALPEMPLFVHPGWYVNVPLETTYETAVRGMPAFWRGVLEGDER